MKKKILFALAMPAFLAACTNEEIVDVQSSEMKEVVGTELVANGLTINFGGDAQSRMTVNGQFDDSDKLGLGWITTTGPSTPQASTVQPDLNKLYANHLFVKDGEADGAFTTYSNVYKGWHFAYYPYTRMAEVGQMVIDNINPAMTKEYKYENGTKAEYMENRFHISAKDFIQSTDVDANNALVGKKFNLLPMVSTFTVATEVANDILNEADLSTLKITKLELIADKDMFYSKAELNPQYLPSAIYTDVDPTSKVQMEYDKAKTEAQMTVANLFGTNKAIAKTGKGKTLSTEIKVDSYKLNGLKELRMNILPIDDLYATASPTSIALKVYVEGGYFTVAYTPVKKDKEGNTIAYTATETANNKAIEKVANLLSVAGHKTTVDNKEVFVNWSNLIGNQAVKVSLAKENFTADYTNIMNIGQWDGCVKVANALGKDETPVFLLGNGAKVEFPAGEMNVPNKGVKVSRSAWGDSQLIFSGKTTWNANISGCDAGTTVFVKEGAELTVENALWASRIVNEGTILAGKKASIGANGEDRFNNELGRVIVEYGAYVYPSSGKAGIIAYNVDGTESAAKINTLVATEGSQNGYAKVNTLIIANNVALDLTKKDANDVNDDRYHGSTQYGNELADMTNVAIEMNGGSILAKQGNVKNVYNVTVKGGENTIKDVDVMGTLTVEAGSVTVDATEYSIEKTVDGNKVIVKVKDAADVNEIEVEKNATLNVTVDTYTSDIVNNGSINVTSPYVLRYANTIEQSGSQSGNIVKAVLDLAEAVAKGGNITLMSDYTLTAPLTITGDVTIDLNGYNIINTTADTNGETCGTDAKACAAIYVNDVNANLTIKGNGEISAITNDATYNIPVWVRNGKVTIEGGEYISGEDSEGNSSHAVYAQNSSKVYINGGIFEVQGSASGMTYPAVLNCMDYSNAKIILAGGSFKNFGETQAAASGAGEIVLTEGYEWSTINSDNYYSVVMK